MCAAVATLLLIHAGLLAYSATRHGPTLNEPGHLVAGLAHWKFGRFEVYRVNPPLVHYVSALPVLLAGYEEDWSGLYDSPAARPEFQMGEAFVKANGERSIWMFTIARWVCIPFSLLGGLFCFLWSRELWGSNLAGLIALSLWCFEPNVLAHAELIIPDAAASALGLGAGYLFWKWLKRPNWSRAFAAGFVQGLAQLTKTSWLILFGLWPLCWLCWLGTKYWRHRRSTAEDVPASTFRMSATCGFSQLVVLFVLALYVLNLGYGFDGSFRRLKEFTFVSKAMTGLEKAGDPGNRFADSWLGELPVPVPKEYLRGIDLQKKDFEHYGQKSYLRGEWKDGGWWYYYLYGLWVKVPHGVQLLFVLALLSRLVARARTKDQGQRTKDKRRSWRDEVLLLTPAVALFVLVSSQTEFNHHFRYVLPCFGFVFVWLGQLADGFRIIPSRRITSSITPARNQFSPAGLLARPFLPVAVTGALVWTAASTLWTYPHQLAYFNELAGGPANGHKHLLHSSLDWGQDLLLAREWLYERGIQPHEVRVVSYSLGLGQSGLLTGDARKKDTARWEIVSSNKVFGTDATWRERALSGSASRIAYTFWAFPVD